MSTANSLELGMLALINDERAEAGLNPLRLITLLNDAAQDHSAWMLEADQFSHTGENGTSLTDRMEQSGYPFEGNSLALENIGWQSARGEEGFVDDVAQVHASLMSSPGHRANILNPNAEDIGIGIEVGTFTASSGDFEAVMVTQLFGTTDADISAWVDPGTGDAPAEVIDDQIVENEEDAPVIPDFFEAEDDTISLDDLFEYPVEADDDPESVVAEDLPEDETDPDTPSEDASNDAPGDVPIVGMPIEEAPELIAIDGVEPCAMTSLTVDISNVFEIKRDGEQITLETTEDKLVAAFMNAMDDWAFLNEVPENEEALNISDLMLEGPDDGCAFAEDMLQDDAEEMAALCA